MNNKDYKFEGTKGEWSVFTSREIGDLLVSEIIIMPKGNRRSEEISVCWDKSKIGRNGGLKYEEAHHNAHLISAAPDLLQACLLKSRFNSEKMINEVKGINDEILFSGTAVECMKWMKNYKKLAIEKALNIK